MERIDYINRHFHPFGAVDSLGNIFDLIDIKQKDEEPVISLKARFLQAFSSLKLGGISIDSALQVSFMLRALLGRYHAVVQEFRLGRHPLTKASLQTVVDQCVNFDKDPFLGPVSKDGKVVRNASANAAGATPVDGKNAYEALRAKSFNYHFGRSGRRPSERTRASACSAMIPPATPTTRAATAQSSRNLVSSWRRGRARTMQSVMLHLV